MRTLRFILVILVSMLVGYCAYPLLNPPKTTQAKLIESPVQVSPENIVANPESAKTISAETKDSSTQATETSPEAEVTVLENAAPAVQVDVNVSGTKALAAANSNQSTVTGGQALVTDFSYYKLKRTKNTVDVSPTDPRVQLIKGRYQGYLNGSPVRMNVNEELITVMFDADFPVSIRTPMFLNVHNDGNKLIIQEDDVKYVLSLKDWPSLQLNYGKGEPVVMNKITDQ